MTTEVVFWIYLTVMDLAAVTPTVRAFDTEVACEHARSIAVLRVVAISDRCHEIVLDRVR